MELLTLFFIAFIILTVWLVPLADHFDTSFYNRDMKHVPLSPPSWLFPIVWTFMYTLISVAGAFYADYNVPMTGDLSKTCITVLTLFFFNLLVLHSWSKFFFKMRSYGIACVVCGLIAGSAVVTDVFFAIQGAWISFGIYTLYPLWTIFAFILNFCWVVRAPKHHGKETEKTEKGF